LHAFERLKRLGFELEYGGPFERIDWDFVGNVPQGLWRDMARRVLGERIKYVWVTKPVSDLNPLSGFTKVRQLYAGHNPTLTDISAVTTLTSLERIYLQHSQISDISPLAGAPRLEVVMIGDTNVTDVDILHRLTRLKILDVMNLGGSDEVFDSLKRALPNCDITCDERLSESEFPLDRVRHP
jgi:hypothetical protein